MVLAISDKPEDISAMISPQPKIALNLLTYTGNFI